MHQSLSFCIVIADIIFFVFRNLATFGYLLFLKNKNKIYSCEEKKCCLSLTKKLKELNFFNALLSFFFENKNKIERENQIALMYMSTLSTFILVGVHFTCAAFLY